MSQFSEATRVYLQISADNPRFWAKGRGLGMGEGGEQPAQCPHMHARSAAK